MQNKSAVILLIFSFTLYFFCNGIDSSLAHAEIVPPASTAGAAKVSDSTNTPTNISPDISTDANPDISPEDIGLNFSDKLKSTERSISYGVQELSTSLDNFFSRENTEVEDTGSRLKVGYAANYVEFEDPAYNLLFGFRLILPHTQKKLQLLIISDEDDLNERNDGESSTPDKKVSESVTSQKIRVGIRSLFHKSKTSAVVLDSGVKIKSPLDPFVRLSGRRSVFFTDYELRFIERIYWFNSTQWGSSTTADLDRPFAPKWLGRFSNVGVLDHQTGLWQLNHVLGLYHSLSERTALAYLLGLTADDEKSLRRQSYYAAFNYRFALIKPWLYLEATPKITWPREAGWEAVPSFYIKIESIYGL